MRDSRDIIIRPLISEKSSDLMEDLKYTFVVSKSANKIEIKRALEEIFDVKVKAVNTANFKGSPVGKKRLLHWQMAANRLSCLKAAKRRREY